MDTLWIVLLALASVGLVLMLMAIFVYFKYRRGKGKIQFDVEADDDGVRTDGGGVSNDVTKTTISFWVDQNKPFEHHQQHEEDEPDGEELSRGFKSRTSIKTSTWDSIRSSLRRSFKAKERRKLQQYPPHITVLRSNHPLNKHARQKHVLTAGETLTLSAAETKSHERNWDMGVWRNHVFSHPEQWNLCKVRDATRVVSSERVAVVECTRQKPDYWTAQKLGDCYAVFMTAKDNGHLCVQETLETLEFNSSSSNVISTSPYDNEP